MLENIVLDRPLAGLDPETTGIDPKIERIVEVSVLKLLPGCVHHHRTGRVNPGVLIPPEATQVKEPLNFRDLIKATFQWMRALVPKF